MWTTYPQVKMKIAVVLISMTEAKGYKKKRLPRRAALIK